MERTEYRDARDFFGAVREAALDADRISRRLARMEASEGPKGQSFDSCGHGSAKDVNGTSGTVARMDYERRVAARREADYALIDKACDVIYGAGQDGLGGIDALLGSAAADVMWWRYCAAATWDTVCAECGVKDSWARYTVERALDECDAYGMWGMTRGLGIAQG